MIVVDGPDDRVASTCRWISDEVTVTEDGRCRVVMRSDSLEWMAATIARLAVEHPVELDEAPVALHDVVSTLAAHLDQLVGTGG